MLLDDAALRRMLSDPVIRDMFDGADVEAYRASERRRRAQRLAATVEVPTRNGGTVSRPIGELTWTELQRLEAQTTRPERWRSVDGA